MSLIAFANGAPDIFSSFETAKDTDEGYTMNIASLLGAFIFTSTLVMYNVLHNSISNSIKVPKLAFFKDTLTYLLTLIVLVIFSIIGKIQVWMIALYFIIYLVYLVISYYIQEDTQKYNIKLDKIEEIIVEQSHFSKNPVDEKLLDFENPSLIKEDYAASILSYKSIMYTYVWDESDSKILSSILFPFKILLILSIPNHCIHGNLEIQNKSLIFVKYISYSIGLSLILIFVFGIDFIIAFICSFVLLISFIIMDLMGILKYIDPYLMPLLSFLSSIAWIQLAASALIDSIKMISFLTEIGKTFLTMVILSTCNSIGDFYSNGSLSKIGNETMAILGCFSGQLFNLLIGLFINFCINKQRDFDIFGFHSETIDRRQKMTALIFIFSALLILLNISIFLINGFKKESKLKYSYLILYAFFIFSSILIVIK